MTLEHAPGATAAIPATDVLLRDGSTVRLRAIGPADESGLLEFLRGLSPESLSLRYFTTPSDTFLAEEARREALRCLHCECDRAADCILRAHAGRLGANALRYRSERRPYERDDSHPLVVYESGKCIACGICVRIAAEAGEELGLTFTGRGMGLRMQVPFGGRLAEGLRAAARACAEACPTGALVLRTEPAAAPDAAR